MEAVDGGAVVLQGCEHKVIIAILLLIGNGYGSRPLIIARTEADG